MRRSNLLVKEIASRLALVLSQVLPVPSLPRGACRKVVEREFRMTSTSCHPERSEGSLK
jgi:hypothetical protein